MRRLDPGVPHGSVAGALRHRRFKASLAAEHALVLKEIMAYTHEHCWLAQDRNAWLGRAAVSQRGCKQQNGAFHSLCEDCEDLQQHGIHARGPIPA